MDQRKITETARPSNDNELMDTGAFQIRQAVRIGILGLLSYWALMIIFPLLGLIMWAVILAIAAYPVFDWTRHLLRGYSRLSALLIVLTGIILVLGPVAILINSLVDTLQFITAAIRDGQFALPKLPASVAHWPLIGDYIDQFWNMSASNIGKIMSEYSEYLLKAGRYAFVTLAQVSVEIFFFLLSIVLAGYLFIAGPRMIPGIVRFVEQAAPRHGASYVEKMAHTIRNVAQGVIGVTLLQSLLAGFTLMLFKVPGTGLITFAALALGIAQIGTGIVLVPVAIWALFTMDFQSSIPLSIILLVITTLDNFLRPMVMAKGLGTPTLVIFFGVLGGLAYHGIIGVFLGPVVLAIVWDLLMIWIGEVEENTENKKHA